MRLAVAVLNWGLGHASRMLPIIELVIQQGHQVYIGSDGAALELLKTNISHPGVTYYQLPSYNISYKSKKIHYDVFRQAPNIIRAVRQEHRIMRQFCEEYQIDAIISDNRLGCFHHRIPSIYITHQTQIHSDWIIGKYVGSWIHRTIAKRYTEVWIPDFDGSLLSGDLSKGLDGAKFIGPLSQFSIIEETKSEVQEKLLIILSGPEPKRSHWEQDLLRKLQEASLACTIVRGIKAAQAPSIQVPDKVVAYNMCNRYEMAALIDSHRYILARSGYTTIMDCIVKRKSACLVPTPGQTEQEYLASHLQGKSPFLFRSESTIDLSEIIRKLSARYNHDMHPFDAEAQKAFILHRLQCISY